MNEEKWRNCIESLIKVTKESGGVQGKVKLINTEFGWDICISVINPKAVEYLEERES